MTVKRPSEPGDRAVVIDAHGWAWQRSGNVWTATTTLLAPHDWYGLAAQRGPLRVVDDPSPKGSQHNPWDALCVKNGSGEPSREGEVCPVCDPHRKGSS